MTTPSTNATVILLVSIDACTYGIGNVLVFHDDRLVSFSKRFIANLIGNSGEAFGGGRPITSSPMRCLSAHFPVVRGGLRRSWHLYGVVNPEGCPGVKGPVPQPVSMSVGVNTNDESGAVKQFFQ